MPSSPRGGPEVDSVSMKPLPLLFSLLVVGCATGERRFDEIMIQKVTTRAAFDFSCPKDKLVVTKIEGRTYGAVGCNRRAAYVPTDNTCGPWSPEANVINLCQI